MRYHGEISISEQQKCISHDIDWSPWFHSTPAAAQQYLGTPLWELALVATFGGVGSVVDLVPRPQRTEAGWICRFSWEKGVV